MNDRKALSIGIVIGGVLLVCCCCFAIVGGGALALQGWLQDIEDFSGFDISTSEAPTPSPQVIQTWQASGDEHDLAVDALHTLEMMVVPQADLGDLAVRLGGVNGPVPETLPDLNAPCQVGAHQEFWVLDTDSNVNFKTPAVLRYVTDHAYFWVGEDVSFRQGDLADLADTFENHIYPTTRAFFGSEWTPGVDEDPHIYILYVSGIGFSTAGYFSSVDSMHPLAYKYSNSHEMFVFNADNSPLDDDYTYGVLAHEFQHMIHWYRDSNEASWVNEGLAEVSTLINGYDPGGFAYYFASNPDHQLNDWPNDDSSTSPYYGAAFLFMTYFLDRMGDDITQQLIAHPENGLRSIDLVLNDAQARDPRTGQPLEADDLVLDWVLTNYLHDASIWDGRFVYNNYPDAPNTYETETLYTCESGIEPRTVKQYGADYIRITCPGQHTLFFEGALNTKLVPQGAYSGKFNFWSNKGDESDMTLTQQFDLTDVSGPILLNYWTWYDIETDYDYLYLIASVDGEHWDILKTPSGTSDDPTGANYGWGYTGFSGDGPNWVQEQVDISAYAGQQVWLRFEYIADATVNGEGFLVDDIAIPSIGYFTDFEEDDGGWDGAGFVRVPNLLPQTFRLALVSIGDETTVEYLTVDENNSLEIPFEIGDGVDEVILVVVGTTRYTRQVASYQFDFLP